MAVNLGDLRERLRASRASSGAAGSRRGGGVGLPSPALWIAGAVALASWMGTFWFWQQYRQAQLEIQSVTAQAQERIAGLTEDNAALHRRVDGIEQERNSAQEQLDAVARELAAVQHEVEQARTAMASAQSERDEITREYDALNQEAEALRAEKRRLEDRLAVAQQDRQQLEQQLVALQGQLGTLERSKAELGGEVERWRAAFKLSPGMGDSPLPTAGGGMAAGEEVPGPATRSVIELPPIIVQHPSRGSTARPMRGRVVSVNEDHRFAVVDKGSLDGLRQGSTLVVYRGAERVAKLTAVRVRDSIAACDISTPYVSVRAGDVVMLSTE